MTKSNGIAKKLDGLLRLLFWLLVGITAFCVISFLMGLVIIRIDPSFAQELMSSFELGGMVFTVAPGSTPSVGFTSAYLLVFLGFFLLAAVTTLVIISLLRRILGQMKLGQPFHSSAAGNLSKLGWIYLVYGVLCNCFAAAQILILNHGYQLETILCNEHITKAVPEFTVDLWFIPVSVGLFLLSWIFKYGAQLQQQVDETL